jgi:hypothetical protein
VHEEARASAVTYVAELAASSITTDRTCDV